MIKRLFPKSEKGSLSLEAALMLPFILTTWLMIANFMNLFVAHLVIQQALNNTVRVVSQYSYLITRYQGNKYLEEITYDGDTFKKAKDIKDNTKKAYDSGKEEVENIKTLKKEIVDSEQDINDLKGALDTTIQNIKDPSGEPEKDLPDNIEKVTENAEKLFGNLQKKEITPGNINEKVVQPAKEFGSSVKAVYETIKDINGDNVKNYFIASTAQEGIGGLIGILMNLYIKNLNLAVTTDIHDFAMNNSGLFIKDMKEGDNVRYLVLRASYTYHNPFNLIVIPDMQISQLATMTAWLGDGNDIRDLAGSDSGNDTSQNTDTSN